MVKNLGNQNQNEKFKNTAPPLYPNTNTKTETKSGAEYKGENIGIAYQNRRAIIFQRVDYLRGAGWIGWDKVLVLGGLGGTSVSCIEKQSHSS